MSYPPDWTPRDDLNDPTRQLPNSGASGTVYGTGSVSQPASPAGAHAAYQHPAPQQQPQQAPPPNQPQAPPGPMPPQVIPPAAGQPPQQQPAQPPQQLPRPASSLGTGAIVGVAALAVALLLIGIPAGLLAWRAAGHLPAADGPAVIGGALLLAGTAALAGGLSAVLLRKPASDQTALQRLLSAPLVFVVVGVLLMLFAAIAA
jgi:hypothetical protein